MKFINKQNKVVVETNSEFVIEQMKKNNLYKELKEVKETPKKENSEVKVKKEDTKKSSKVK